MTLVRLALESLRYHWRRASTVALGVAAATAVLTGALLIGDSMRGSLRKLTLERLGSISDILVGDRFFRPELADELAANPKFKDQFAAAVPCVLLQGTLASTDTRHTKIAGHVTIVGVDERFGKLGEGGPSSNAGAGEVVLNQPLADTLIALNEIEAKNLAEIEARLGRSVAAGAVTIDDVITMTRAGVAEELIMNHVRSYGMDAPLQTNDLVLLRQQGVSSRVIQVMQAAPPPRMIKAGDEVILRIGRRSQIPGDSPLGRKTETVRSERLTVREIIPNAGLGRFGLQATQRQSLTAFVAPATLQRMLEQPDRVNAILVSSDDERDTDSDKALEAILQPKLDDYGLLLQDTGRGYFNFTSVRMLLSEPAERAAAQAFKPLRAQPVLTYLANYISAGDAKIPYSTVTALDVRTDSPLGPFVDLDDRQIEQLADDEIIINTWADDDFKQQGAELNPGDTISLTYFLPESTHGEVREATHDFRLKTIVKLADAAADPNFTPELKGITDKRSIANWDPPFPYDPQRVRSTPPNDIDEQYWNQHKTTPKAFISLAAGRKLWASRFGETTSLRIPKADSVTADSLTARLKLTPVEMGFDFLPVKEQGLQAASGTTPFQGLFLGFSFFIIASAVLLVALLFRLQMDERAKEIGVMAASGIRRRQIALLLASEGLIVCLAGGTIGVGLGIGYAKLMLAALSSPDWWQGAISTPFLELFITPQSLLIGFVSGSLVAMVFILWSLRRLGRRPVRQLLGGQTESADSTHSNRSNLWTVAAGVLLVGAVALGLFALRLGGEAQAGAFFGSGAFVLLACLILLRARLQAGSVHSKPMTGPWSVIRLAARNAMRHPSRSTLTVALVGAASFLIVAISAFRLDPAAVGAGKDSGSGGFSLVAETDLPIYQNLTSADGLSDLGIPIQAQTVLTGSTIIPLRVQAGDDASCLNLYRPTQPRALGVTADLIRRGGFSWAGSAAATDEERTNPWLLLNQTSTSTDSVDQVPVVLDANTATYSLHLPNGVGDEITIRDGFGRPLRLQVVGLLKNSIFQGDLLLSEHDFLKHFPEVSGYQYFLIDTPPEQQQAVQKTLQSSLGDYGLIAEPTLERLADFLTVQNTYLTTFQSLGGLGLLLGTFGLATVQLRNVLERRAELALMQATGWRQSLLARLVLYENGAILLGGLAIGVAAALVAVLPHLLQGGAGIPWRSLAVTLGLVAIVGLLAGWLATRSVFKRDLIQTLRAE